VPDASVGLDVGVDDHHPLDALLLGGRRIDGAYVNHLPRRLDARLLAHANVVGSGAGTGTGAHPGARPAINSSTDTATHPASNSSADTATYPTSNPSTDTAGHSSLHATFHAAGDAAARGGALRIGEREVDRRRQLDRKAGRLVAPAEHRVEGGPVEGRDRSDDLGLAHGPLGVDPDVEDHHALYPGVNRLLRIRRGGVDHSLRRLDRPPHQDWRLTRIAPARGQVEPDQHGPRRQPRGLVAPPAHRRDRGVGVGVGSGHERLHADNRAARVDHQLEQPGQRLGAAHGLELRPDVVNLPQDVGLAGGGLRLEDGVRRGAVERERGGGHPAAQREDDPHRRERQRETRARHTHLLHQQRHPLGQVGASEEQRGRKKPSAPIRRGELQQRLEVRTAIAQPPDDLLVDQLLAGKVNLVGQPPGGRVEPGEGPDDLIARGPQPVEAPHVEQFVTRDGSLLVVREARKVGRHEDDRAREAERHGPEREG